MDVTRPAREPLEIRDLLRQVSRSFNTTLSILPRPVRRPIGLAYLLARATDTVADTGLVPVERRLELLSALRKRVAGIANVRLKLEDLCSQQGTPAEGRLLGVLPELLEELDRLPQTDQSHIRRVIEIITSGQELDLHRFRAAKAEAIVALSSADELDDYTYRVAGCVGEFWTHLCCTHLFAVDPVSLANLLKNGVRFGKGLQLVNILRDLPVDLRAGRCYLPGLPQAGLRPADLLDSSNEARLRPIYNPWLQTARGHLRAGWDYTNALPWRCFRLRLACAWPILIGLDTLAKLERENVLDASRRIKTSRKQVRSVMIRSTLAAPWPRSWRRLVG